MFATTTDDLAKIFRSEVDDPIALTVAPLDADRLWKDADVYQYMTEAGDAVARFVDGIYKILQLPLTAGVQLVPLPKHVLHVREARLVTAQLRLKPLNINEAANMAGDDYGIRVQNQFWTMTGVPRYFVRDYDRRGILLAPIPTSADTIEMQCTGTLGAPLQAGMMLPFAEAPDLRLMLLYMKYLAYRKHDAETYDRELSDSFKKQFDYDAMMRKELLESYRRTPGTIDMWAGPEMEQ